MAHADVTAIEVKSKGPLNVMEVLCYIHHKDGEITGLEIYDDGVFDDWLFVSAERLSDYRKATLKAMLDIELEKQRRNKIDLEL